MAGKYEIEALIGQGGMGAVYRAQHTLTHRRVALKWLLADDAAMRMRFVREARAMGALEHPNVVGILDIGEEDGAVYLVMEYVEGESLREHLDRRPVSPMRAVRLLMPALEGIAAAHQAGIVHRDLKPANLFVCLDRDGTAYGTKVLDFGVALSLRQSDGTMGLTQSGAVVGTPRYMAPEQIRGHKVDARTDQFAMGLILYEMLTGRLPYDAAVYEALVVEIATVPPLSPRVFVPDLPEGLPEVVLKALAKSPDDRFPDIGALAVALEPFGDGVVFSPPRQAHARRSMLGEDLMELAIASAGLTPSHPGPAAQVDLGPPTRRFGAAAEHTPTSAAGRARAAAVRASATTLDAPDSEREQATRQAGLRARQAVLEKSGERTRASLTDAAAPASVAKASRRPWVLVFLLLAAGLLGGAWSLRNGPTPEAPPAAAPTSVTEPSSAPASAAAAQGTTVNPPATEEAAVDEARTAGVRNADSPAGGAPADPTPTAPGAASRAESVPAEAPSPEGAAPAPADTAPGRGRRRLVEGSATMDTATSPSMSAMGRSGAFSVEDF